MKSTLLRLLVVSAVLSSTTAKAAFVTGLVDTTTNLSFSFTGTGISDLLTVNPPITNLTNWKMFGFGFQEGHSASLIDYTFVVVAQHMVPTGSLVVVGQSSPVPYGTSIVSI